MGWIWALKKGTEKNTMKEKIRNYPITQKDYQVCIRVTKNKEGMWEVMTFEKDHSHVFVTPSKTHFIQSHRYVTHMHRNLSDTFS